ARNRGVRRADVAGRAQRGPKVGHTREGGGGHPVAHTLTPAAGSLKVGALSLGLAHGVKVRRPVAAGQTVRWADVAVDESSYAVQVRREMEKLFAPAAATGLAP